MAHLLKSEDLRDTAVDGVTLPDGWRLAGE
jgi:hypothetical protein